MINSTSARGGAVMKLGFDGSDQGWGPSSSSADVPPVSRLHSTPSAASTFPSSPLLNHVPGAEKWQEGEALGRILGLAPQEWTSAAMTAQSWNVGVHAVLISTGRVDAAGYVRAVAQALAAGLAPEDLRVPPVAAVGRADREPIYRGVQRDGSIVAVIAADALPFASVAAAVHAQRAQGNAVVLATRRHIENATDRATRRLRRGRATFALVRKTPELSAARGIYTWQALTLGTVAGLWIGAAVFLPEAAVTVVVSLLTLAFAGIVLIRMAALANLTFGERSQPAPLLADGELPTYSVLVPVFDEAEVLRGLIHHLARLDYPPAKLEVLLIFEETDLTTKIAALGLSLPPNFRTLVVPDGLPRTKPKALNYALQSAVGNYVVVFDAEDRPEPDQLRRATALFRHHGARLACVQARLNVFNARDSWLARQFAVEYSALFGAILPALEWLRLPLPLGGTSNHFSRAVLDEVGGWDPFNVTEDADLGFRLARLGWQTAMLPSTTWEEAPVSLGQWWRQRTRWMKGWLQTYAVHTRAPLALFRELGFWRTLGFHLYFGGLILSALVQPIFIATLVADTVVDLPRLLEFAPIPPWLWHVATFNLVAGYGCAIMVGLIASRRSGHRLALAALTMPVCWLLISFATYRAIWQLWRAPFHWEKTPHGRARTSIAHRRPRRP